MSFQKLFKKADEVSGCDKAIPVPQSDTSVFDSQQSVEDDEGSENAERSSRIKVSDRELDKLRSIMKKVTVANKGQKPVVRRLTHAPVSKQVSEPKPQQQLRILPEVSWEAEIEQAMKLDTSDEDRSGDDVDGTEKKRSRRKDDGNKRNSNIQNNLESVLSDVSTMRPQQRVTFDVAPFNCFDNDVGAEDNEDPLDVLIPNRQRDAFAFTDILTPEEPESEKEEEASSSKSDLTALAKSSGASSLELDAMEAEPVVTMTKAERDKQKKLEKALRIKGVDIGFDAASSIERSANQRPRDNLPQYRSRASRSLIAALNHCNIAPSHKNAKPDLYEVELKYFHRPRMIRERDRPWQIFLKSAHKKLSGSSSRDKLGLSTSIGSGKFATAEVDKQNLSIASSTADFILLEYVEEFPPVLLNYGMASAMFNYYRAPEQNEEEDNTRTKARTESNKLVESVLNDTNRSRLPRHLMLLLQLRNVKQTYDHDVTFPRMKQGEMKVLNSEDDSPFLGKIEEGDIQQSFTNNLFRAPIFKHTAHPTDFLLIRTKLQAGMLTYTMREIPSLYLSGQMEPQKIVPRPVPMITQLQEKFYLLAAVRYLQAHFDGVDFADLQRNLLKYCLKESSSPHKAQHRAKLKPIVRKVGDEVKDNVAGVKWYCKDFSDRAVDADEAADLERRFSPEELAKTFTPEDVCLQESANAAEYRLFQQHITDLDLSKVELWLTHSHRVKQLLMDRAEKGKRLANELRTSNPSLSQSIERFVAVTIKQIQRTDARLAIGRFLFDRLVVAPWNTTEAYVRSHLERDGQGKMELQGVGDPSGRGEGFSFVRIIKQARGPGGTVAKKNTVKYFDTDKDLRKLTKKDAVRLLVALGVREAEAMALKRWDRVHMIREFSTKLEKTGLAKELHKYARSGVEANTTSAESFQTTAQDIWNRQKRALTNTSRVLAITNSAASAGADSKDKSKGKSSGEKSDSEASDSSDSDIDFGEHIARSLAARAAASASIEEKQSARKEEERKRIEEEKSEFSNIGTFFNSLDKPTSGTSAAQKGSTGGSDSFATSISKFGDGAAALKKRKVQVGISGLGGASDAMAASSGGPDMAATQDHQLSGQFTVSAPVVPPAAALQSDWVRPRRVVKRIIRTVLSDGTEMVRVEFVFAESEVERVERLSTRWRKEREARRSATAAGGFAAGAGGAGLEEEEEADDIAPTSMASMKINLSRIKKVVDQNNQMLKKERAAEEQDPYSISYETGTKVAKSSKRSIGTVINNRVPRISFAVRLEEEVMKIWNNKHSIPFRVPVNAFDAPGYYQRVTDPICLTDIREKIVSYQYETAAALLEDFARMVRNSEIYNGTAHYVTTAANKLLNMLQINLRHDREHLGAEHDSIGIMEEAIRRKKVYLRKNIFDAQTASSLQNATSSSLAVANN
mmetsp:Transcript_45235/g.79006  ORF Transcript_45235/g.79006 Transcript_45235/m.79006 type:complete len:1418 (-) Transcript_45235:87-4340(-)